MVDSGTAIAKTRSQIAFIGREVAALEADFACAIEDNTKLRAENKKIRTDYENLQSEHAKLKQPNPAKAVERDWKGLDTI